MTDPALEALAHNAAHDVLDRVVRRGEPLTIVDSPPGAGKTWIVERLVALATGPAGRRVLCVTNTNNQARDLVSRLAQFRLPQLAHLVSDQELANNRMSPATVTKDATTLPAGPGVVVATLSKTLHSLDKFGPRPFGLAIVDEAYQANGADVMPALALSDHFALIGDPGQLQPVVVVDTAWFEASAHRVHKPAPKYLLDLDPGRAAHIVRLPASRRLLPDTVDLVQPAFYQDLPFGSLADPEERALSVGLPGLGHFADRVLDAITRGASIVQVLLPPAGPSFEEFDSDLPRIVAELVHRFLTRRLSFADGTPVTEQDFACIDPHVASGEASRQALRASGYLDVHVDTPERWQGLQKPIVIVKHPLNEMVGGASFGFDPGRWCVSLSRHTHACIVLGRASIGPRLERYVHSVAEAPCEAEDSLWRGYAAHRRVWDGLEALGRNVHLNSAA